MKRMTAIASIVGLLALSACTSATDDSHTESQVAEASPQAHETQNADGDYVQTEAEPPATASGATSYNDDGTGYFDFGKTATFPSGMELTVDYLGETKFSEHGTASNCTAGDPVAVFKLTIANNTGSTVNPSDSLDISGVYYKDGVRGSYDPVLVDAPNVFDDWQGKKLDKGMSITELPDDESATAYAGMCRPDASNDETAVHGTFADEEVATPLWTVPGADPYDRRRPVS
ncbi:hypothetical protein [Brevibacterium casei]|uniref:DUF4352 domain-containing protein n=1 Tax=Brevibacterium casei TaxID=33889 RepID=A0A7T2TFU3_9MICO|nr:hypothetical protein [Brevibacterium casei]MCT1551537.1 hypothetical protein [Brevibacterium casei]MCT1560980.1 hypothetical protein [Brevibacterium casei]MCT2209296.1 hypothetical protein [Brevibacterium casei]QPS33123.1 hypothetical protein I6G59_14350 [Brevibacterium casei]